MDEEAETKAIEKWLRMVDKPLATKERDRKDAEPSNKAYTDAAKDKSAGSGGLRWVRQGATFCEPDKTLTFCIPQARTLARVRFC